MTLWAMAQTHIWHADFHMNKLVDARNKLMHANAFDSDFKKRILFCFAYVFKITSYFYKRLILQNDSTDALFNQIESWYQYFYCSSFLLIYIKLDLNVFIFFFVRERIIFTTKKIISIPLMIENPVRSPIVPPIVDKISTNLAAWSLVILSNVGVSK